jgi:hypothetical protein
MYSLLMLSLFVGFCKVQHEGNISMEHYFAGKTQRMEVLASDTLYHILSFLSHVDVNNFSKINKEMNTMIHDTSLESSTIIWETIYMNLLLPQQHYHQEKHWKQLVHDFVTFKFDYPVEMKCSNNTFSFPECDTWTSVICKHSFDMKYHEKLVWRVILDRFNNADRNYYAVSAGFQVAETPIKNGKGDVLGEKSNEYGYLCGNRGLYYQSKYYPDQYGNGQYAMPNTYLKDGGFVDISITRESNSTGDKIKAQFFVNGELAIFEFGEIIVTNARYVTPAVSFIYNEVFTIVRIL